jgi:hypothetical protein
LLTGSSAEFPQPHIGKDAPGADSELSEDAIRVRMLSDQICCESYYGYLRFRNGGILS